MELERKVNKALAIVLSQILNSKIKPIRTIDPTEIKKEKLNSNQLILPGMEE